MATLLLIVIYIAFIGLGIPDSLFGTAWPAIYGDFNLPISYSNFVTIICSCGGLISGAFSARLINRFGTKWVTAFSTALTALSLLGCAFSQSFIWLCLLAIPLGIGGGAVDSALNNYVALHFSARHMSFLHCFYGVGITVSPALLSLAITSGGGWRGGYLLAAGVQGGITLLAFLSIPLWGKNRGENNEEEPKKEEKGITLSIKEQLRLPGLLGVLGIFLFSCSIEAICGGWGSTYLVEHHGETVDAAARLLLFYYAGMTLGRFLSGVLATRMKAWQLIFAGQAIVVGAMVLVTIGYWSSLVTGIALLFVGLGNGPMYPNLMHLTPENFGREYSQSAMSAQVTAAYTGIMVTPILFGLLAQLIGAHIFPFFLGGAVALMLLFTFYTKMRLSQKKK